MSKISPQRHRGIEENPPFLPTRRTLCLCGALFLLLGGTLVAQEAPEPEFDLIGSTTQKLAYTAPDWKTDVTAAWGFTADLKPKFTFDAVSFQADTSWTFPLSASLVATAPTVAVYEAYFRLRPTDSLDVTLGQKRFALGVGQTFTVGDSLNPVVGFFDQKTGFRGVTAEWSPVSWASVSAALSTEGAVPGTAGGPDLGAAAQLSLLLDQWQLTASAVGRKDVSFTPALGVSYDFFGIIFTAEGAAEFLPQGVRPDGALSTWKAPEAWNEPALSASAGARWLMTLGDWDLTVAGEYLHWAQGWTNAETDDWKVAVAQAPAAALPQLQAVRKALPLRSRENAFFRASVGTGGEFLASGFAAVDLQDQSWLGQASVVWTPWDNLDLAVTLQAVSGAEGSSWQYLNPNKDRYQASLATTYHF